MEFINEFYQKKVNKTAQPVTVFSVQSGLNSIFNYL